MGVAVLPIGVCLAGAVMTLLFDPSTTVFIARLALRGADCGSPPDENTSVGRSAPLEEVEEGVLTEAAAVFCSGRGLGVEVAGVAAGGALWSGVTLDPWELT